MTSLIDYIHEKAIYYIISKLYINSLGRDSDSEPVVYDFKDHRAISCPSFEDQRLVMRFLEEKGYITIVESLNHLRESASLEDSYVFKILPTGLLGAEYRRLILKLQEDDLNRVASNESEIISLELVGKRLYIKLPQIRLRVNPIDFKENGDPQLLLDMLLNRADGMPINRKEFLTSRRFIDVLNKAGIKRSIRSVFVVKVTDESVQLLPQVAATLKDIEQITLELLELDVNKGARRKYLAGIEPLS